MQIDLFVSEDDNCYTGFHHDITITEPTNIEICNLRILQEKYSGNKLLFIDESVSKS